MRRGDTTPTRTFHVKLALDLKLPESSRWDYLEKDAANTNSSIQAVVDGVADSEFQPGRWWREPDSARIWLVEFAKLVRAI
jgi:hypothetical protein